MKKSKINHETIYDAVRFGYQYRLRYENDYKRHKKLPVNYALLETDPALLKLGKYVIEGLIANLAYDLIKKYVNVFVAKNKSKVLVTLKTDINIKKLIIYIRDYLTFKQLPNKSINTAIHEERQVHYKVQNALPYLLQHHYLTSPKSDTSVSKPKKRRKHTTKVKRHARKTHIKK